MKGKNIIIIIKKCQKENSIIIKQKNKRIIIWEIKKIMNWKKILNKIKSKGNGDKNKNNYNKIMNQDGETNIC